MVMSGGGIMAGLAPVPGCKAGLSGGVSTYATSLGNVDRLSGFSHMADNPLSPGDTYNVVPLAGGETARPRVNVENFRYQSLFTTRTLHEEEGAPIRVHQNAQVHQDAAGQAPQVQIVGDVLDYLQKEVTFVLGPQLAFEFLVLAGVPGEPDLRLDEHAEHVPRGGRQGEELTHALQAAASLRQSSLPLLAERRLVRPEDVSLLAPSEVVSKMFLRVGSLVAAEVGVEEAAFLSHKSGVRGGLATALLRERIQTAPISHVILDGVEAVHQQPLVN